MADIDLTFDANLGPFDRKVDRSKERIRAMEQQVSRLTTKLAKAARRKIDDRVYQLLKTDGDAGEKYDPPRFLCTKDGYAAICDDAGREVGYAQRPASVLAANALADISAWKAERANRFSERIGAWAAAFAVAWIVGVSAAVWAGAIG